MKNTRYIQLKIAVTTVIAIFLASNPLIQASAEIETKASIGWGFDDNIYKTPANDYFDPNYAASLPIDANGNNINVISSGGAYTPYNVNVNGRFLTSPNVFFVGEYKLKGIRYVNDKYSNANRTDNKISFGVMRQFNSEGVKEEYVEGDILIGHQKRLYLDRDTGDDHRFSLSNKTDISERYIYDYTGFEISYKDRISPLQKKASFRLEKRDYQDVLNVGESQYDHTYKIIKLGIDKKLTSKLKFGADFDYYTYDYTERKSRNSIGKLSIPGRQYRYRQTELSLRYRMSKSWHHSGHIAYKTRKDIYAGYDNYSKILTGFKSQWDFAVNQRLEFAFDKWSRRYPNAFAFDVEGQQDKSYDGTDLVFSYQRQLSEDLELIISYNRIDENSSDTRYQYLKSLYLISAEYKIK